MQIGIFCQGRGTETDKRDSSLGTLEEVVQKVQHHWPDAHIGRYSWGYEGSYDTGECRVDMSFLIENDSETSHDMVTCIGIEAHGDYDCFEPLISDLCKVCGWRARDMDNGEPIDLGNL